MRSGATRFSDVFDIVIAVGVGNEIDADMINDMVQKLGVATSQSDIRTVPDYQSLIGLFPNIRSRVSNIMNQMTFSRVRRAWPVIKGKSREY